jgi:hypothetical protein
VTFTATKNPASSKLPRAKPSFKAIRNSVKYPVSYWDAVVIAAAEQQQQVSQSAYALIPKTEL